MELNALTSFAKTQPTLTLPAPAKLNLFLHITGRRTDGYHNLESVFQFLDLADLLHFTPNRTGQITLECLNLDSKQLAIPAAQNLVVKAAQLLQQQLPVVQRQKAGVSIQLEKYLPMGGGLGGGSSDAATTLLALNRLWQLNLPLAELATLGLQLGADVPVFVHGFAAFARGVGEQLEPVYPDECFYVVVHPNVHISTAEIFQHKDLTRNSQPLPHNDIDWKTCRNDCEPLVRSCYRQVAVALDWLLQYGPSRMTGTGACIFAPFATKAAAEHALANLPNGCRGFIAQGQNRSPAHLALAHCSEG